MSDTTVLAFFPSRVMQYDMTVTRLVFLSVAPGIVPWSRTLHNAPTLAIAQTGESRLVDENIRPSFGQKILPLFTF